MTEDTAGVSDEDEPTAELLRDLFDLADEVVDQVTDDDVEARLRHLRATMARRRSARRVEALDEFCSTAAEVRSLSGTSAAAGWEAAAAARLQVEGIMAAARRDAELLAAQIHRAAEETRQHAEKLRADAETFADAALDRAAKIVTEARDEAARILAEAEEAARVREQALQHASEPPVVAWLYEPSDRLHAQVNEAWADSATYRGAVLGDNHRFAVPHAATAGHPAERSPAACQDVPARGAMTWSDFEENLRARLAGQHPPRDDLNHRGSRGERDPLVLLWQTGGGTVDMWVSRPDGQAIRWERTGTWSPSRTAHGRSRESPTGIPRPHESVTWPFGGSRELH